MGVAEFSRGEAVKLNAPQASLSFFFLHKTNVLFFLLKAEVDPKYSSATASENPFPPYPTLTNCNSSGEVGVSFLMTFRDIAIPMIKNIYRKRVSPAWSSLML